LIGIRSPLAVSGKQQPKRPAVRGQWFVPLKSLIKVHMSYLPDGHDMALF